MDTIGAAAPRWPARARAAVLFAACALAAGLWNLGRLHALEHGDSIVPVLISLQRWTPFYWDQERYGMLVPLLAIPVRDPLWNLLLQRGLLVLAGLAAVVLLARHVLADRDWPVAGALAVATLLALAPAGWQFEYLGDQPYGLSLALALAGLAFAEPLPEGSAGARRPAPRYAVAFALVVAAHWVNAATGILLLPLAIARAGVDLVERVPSAAVRRRLMVDAALLVGGLVAGHLMLRLWPLLSETPLRLALGLVPMREWPASWEELLAHAWADEGRWALVLAATAAAGIAFMRVSPALRPALPGALLRAGVLVVAALAYALFAGVLEWVRDNAYHWRYLAPSAVMIHLAAISLVAEPLSRFRRGFVPAFVAAVALVPVGALAVAGPPSLARVRADLDHLAGRHTADVLAAGCPLVAGDYWTVWPAVWHASLALRERGERREIWGVTHRSNPTLGQWAGLRGPGLRICVAGDAVEAERWLRAYHLWPVREVERRPTLSVVVPEAPAR